MHKVFGLLFFGISTITLLSCTQNNSEKEKQVIGMPTVSDSLTYVLDSVQRKGILPGFSLSIFTEDSILFAKGFGYANATLKQPYSTKSIQITASITKTLVGLSLAMLVENGEIDLEEGINAILPFSVINPNYPNNTISVRHLATHTAGINDPNNSDKGYRFNSPLHLADFSEEYAPLLPYYNVTEDLTMAEFLKRKLNQNGQWYSPSNFIEYPPGTKYNYSNLGIALLAYIIEIKTKMSFAQFTQERILNPLKMHASTWELEAVSKRHKVQYYNEFYKPLPEYYIITYPDGGLYSSVEDMTVFLQEIIKGYNGEGQLLSKKGYRNMLSKQILGVENTEGLCWDLSFSGLAGHAGNDFGTATLMYFSLEQGVGRILFTNVTTEKENQEAAFYGIYNTLFKFDLRTKK